MDKELREYLDKQFGNINEQLVAIRKTQLEDNGKLENHENRLQKLEQRMDKVS